MIFVFDIDDTICETDKNSEEYILNFFDKKGYPYKQVSSVERFAEAKFNWSVETAERWYKKYGDEMMLNFEPKPHVVATFRMLRELDHKIIIATARSTDWHTDPRGVTLKWLENNKIEYDKIYLGRVDKEQICIGEGADVFVDDDIKICEKVAKDCPRTKVLLMKSNYNKGKNVSKDIIKIDDVSRIFTLMALSKIGAKDKEL